MWLHRFILAAERIRPVQRLVGAVLVGEDVRPIDGGERVRVPDRGRRPGEIHEHRPDVRVLHGRRAGRAGEVAPHPRLGLHAGRERPRRQDVRLELAHRELERRRERGVVRDDRVDGAPGLDREQRERVDELRDGVARERHLRALGGERRGRGDQRRGGARQQTSTTEEPFHLMLPPTRRILKIGSAAQRPATSFPCRGITFRHLRPPATRRAGAPAGERRASRPFLSCGERDGAGSTSAPVCESSADAR